MLSLRVHFDSKQINMDGEMYPAPDMPTDIFGDAELGNRQPLKAFEYDRAILRTERVSRVRQQADTEYFPHMQADALVAPFLAIAEAAKQKRIDDKAKADREEEQRIEDSRLINERRAAQDEADHQERLRVERAAEDARRDAQIAVGGIPNAKE